MESLVNPILLYAFFGIGAMGIILALPRRGSSPQILGALIALLAFGGLMLAMLPSAANHIPNLNFYLFSVLALGSALRVISHPRPVYSALYFVLTIIASVGLYVLLSAEFMAFALLIVYAGAILITYLFVIMLATESPTAEESEALSDYDRYSREPVLATGMGFLLVALLTTLMFSGAGTLKAPVRTLVDNRITELPGRVEAALRDAGTLKEGEIVARTEAGKLLIDPAKKIIVLAQPGGGTRSLTPEQWPAGLELSNIEGVAFSLLSDLPGAIEIAGVVLLMAMLGAVVLARKKVEMDEAAKLAAARRHLVGAEGGAA